MTLTVNGRSRSLPEGTTLDSFLAGELRSTRGTAAAVNGEVVPRAEWAQWVLVDGQAIEIVTAVQGG
jgi:sulfur carrier protein